MRRGGLALFLLLALGGCAGATATALVRSPAAGAPGAGPRAERPTYALGDRWIRSDGIFELIRIEPDTYVFSKDADEEIHLGRDLVVTRYRRFGRSTMEFTPAPRLDWPLAVGKRGALSGKFRGSYGDPYDADLSWVVEGYEDVSVPAGTFKAFKVVYHVKPRLAANFAPQRWGASTGPPSVTIRMWYAPEVRQFVKAGGDVGIAWIANFELVAVDAGESEPLKVVVRKPEDQVSLLPDSDVTLSGTATGGKGVARVTVTVNGEPVATEGPRGEMKKAVVLSVPLRFRDGKNVILVTATDPDGATSQEARTVFYSAPVTVPYPPAGQTAHSPRDWIRLTIPARPRDNPCFASVAVNDLVAQSFRCDDTVDGNMVALLRLDPGENRVRIRYDLLGGRQEVDERTIVFDPAVGSPVAVATAAPPATPLPSAESARPAQEQRLAAERKRAEDQRLAEERRLAEDKQRREAEQQRLAEEQRRREEAGRLAEAQRKSEAEQRLAEEQRRREIERLAEEQRQRAEAQRLAEEQRKRDAEQRRAAEEQRKRDEAQRVAALPPLQLTLSSPRDQARFEHESIGLAGLVAGGKGVSRVTVSLNGVEVTKQEERTPQRAVALSLPIKLREGQNTLVVTATEADGTISQNVRTVFYEKPQALTVAMRFPQDHMRVTEPASVAAAIVSSSKGVARVSVTVNGVEVHQQADRAQPRSLLVTVPLKLQPGVNIVAVSATDNEGTVRQEVRTVILDASPVVATPATAPSPPPQHERWAVVIGVGQYEHPSIPRLRYTVADAEAIHQTLIEAAGFRKEHVLLLTDKSERKPTLKNIKWALGTFLARSAKKDDTVLIFFAGHGAPETDQRGLERDGLAKYLIPSDAEADDLYSSALPMDELQTIFGRIEAERVVAFLDACYSGAAGGRTFAAKKTRAGSVDDLFLERLTRSKGRAIITASRTNEVSIELPELGHGIFTYYLVNGLKGAADLNRDGIISLQELYEYVEQQVTTKSRAVGGNQHPVMKGELEGVLPLAKVRR